MNSIEKIASQLKYESSLIFVLFLGAGVIVLVTEPSSLIGAALVAAAIITGIIGFSFNSIRENHELIVRQKDNMIKDLTKARKQEMQHSEDLRRQVDRHATGGWESSSPK